MNKLHQPTLRVIRILNFISKNNFNEGVSFSNISEKLNIPKSTLSPILKTLNTSEYIYLDKDSRKYTIGMGIFTVGQSVLNNTSLFDYIKKTMDDIVFECNEICQLGILNSNDKSKVLYIAKVEPLQSIKLMSSIGSSLPAHASALGKSLLYKTSKNKVQNIFNGNFYKLTPNTITNFEDFCEDLEEVSKKGYSYESGESTEDIECIAVPIEKDSRVIAAISLSIPIYRTNPAKKEKAIKVMLDKKEDIEKFIESTGLEL